MTTDMTAGRAPERDFRTLMSMFPTGVAVIGALDGAGRPWGMTCSSLCSVCLDPPTLLVCVRSSSPTLRALVHRGTFTVNLLHHAAMEIAELFASGDPDRFQRIRWHLPETAAGPHLRDAAHAIGDCEVDDTRQVGDHSVVFARVLRVHIARTDGTPLLYGMRRYGTWPDAPTLPRTG
jgi:flavin reductase (DIM6/NTAB) family NADH-FMN oxidoreductase RutF